MARLAPVLLPIGVEVVMFYPTLGMMAAAWLLIVSFFGLETGFRADMSVFSGIVALPLALASIWSFRAGKGMALVGLILGVTNLLVPTSMGGLASYAIAGAALTIAGMAPQPVSSHEPAGEQEGAAPMARTPPPHTAEPHPAPA